jgi:hypothetical protein
MTVGPSLRRFKVSNLVQEQERPAGTTTAARVRILSARSGIAWP